jgi:hypothetical protein
VLTWERERSEKKKEGEEGRRGELDEGICGEEKRVNFEKKLYNRRLEYVDRSKSLKKNHSLKFKIIFIQRTNVKAENYFFINA